MSAVPMQAFLGNWQDELANARRSGLARHHVTFTIAFERSFSHLSADLQTKLALLSVFPFPFFAEGAAMVWGGGDNDRLSPEGFVSVNSEQLFAAKQILSEFTRRSLLEVDSKYNDGTTATCRFQPALRQEAAYKLDPKLTGNQKNGYATYGAWLTAYGGTRFNDIGFNRVVRLSMDALEKGPNLFQGLARLTFIHQLAWLKNAWGETRAASDLLNSAISQNMPDPLTDPESAKVESKLRFELAGINITHGNLNRALQLYQDSLQLLESLGDKQGKAVSLSNMAQVFLARGDLDRALQLYQESLQLKEELGDKVSKAASLDGMARVFEARGDLDRALQLNQESLLLFEQSDDKTGRSATLSTMGSILYKRGDLVRALQLNQERLQLAEQLGDKQGKAVALSNIARVFLDRGELDRALALSKESLQLKRQLGDKRGQANSLLLLEEVYLKMSDVNHYKETINQSLAVMRELGDMNGIAVNIIKLGTIAQGIGNKEIALGHYLEGLALFEKLDAEAIIAQVKQLIASLENEAILDEAFFAQVEIAEARSAVKLMRGSDQEREALIKLKDLLYCLADYYQDVDRYDDAVQTMEEVVAIDLQTEHQDLEFDREELENFRYISSLTPEEREQFRKQAQQTEEEQESSPNEEGGFETQLQAQLAQLPPEKRAEAQIRKAYAEFQRMSPEEQAAVVDGQRRAQIENAANQVRDAGLAYVRKQAPKRDVLQMLEGASKEMKVGESAGSPWLEVAALCDALVALIKGESISPVPAAYAGHFSAVQSEIKK